MANFGNGKTIELYLLRTWVKLSSKGTYKICRKKVDFLKSKLIYEKTKYPSTPHAELSDALCVTRVIDKKRYITVGCLKNEYFGGIVDSKTLEVVQSAIKKNPAYGNDMGFAIRNIELIYPFFVIYSSTGYFFFGALNDDTNYVEKIAGYLTPTSPDFCELDHGLYLTKDCRYFYVYCIVGEKKGNASNHAILRIDTKKLKGTLLKDYQINDQVEEFPWNSNVVGIKASYSKLLLLGKNSLELVNPKTMKTMKTFSDPSGNFSCMATNRKFVYISNGTSELILCAKSLKIVGSGNSGFPFRRRQMFCFNYQGIPLIALHVDVSKELVILAHYKNELIVIGHQLTVESPNARYFGLEWLPQHQAFVISNEFNVSNILSLKLKPN